MFTVTQTSGVVSKATLSSPEELDVSRGGEMPQTNIRVCFHLGLS